jgi:hypothetical protein
MIPIIWGTSPLELPNEMYGTSRGYPTEEIAYTVPPESAEVIKRAIYDVMAGFEGDNFDPGMVINEGFLPPALLGREYEQELPVINAPSAPSWTLVSGELPEGLKLQDGKITGTPTEEKKAGFTVKAEADGETAERRLTLYAEKERPLEIVEPEIKKLARDEYFLTTLKSEGAIGRTTWSIAEGEGEMPKGFRLNDSGLLLGTPGESGTFEPTLRVTDNHPVEPRTATRQLTIEVGPPSEGTAIVPRVTEEWKQDGKLDEPFWDFKHEIKKDGKTAGTFSLVYIEDPEKRNPSKTRDLLLAVKVDAAENSPVPPEAVHVYIDAAHNRELIYNEDDLHWYVEKSGKDEVPQGYKSDHALDEAVTVNDDGSWQMEVEISRKVFAGFGVHTTFGPNISYGFDVAIGSVEDPEQRAYWQGDPSIDEDTSGFGSIVLEGPEAAEEEE